ncbi:MAG: NUDIX domain-containing protein [bacterium]|nr:NUDIX domain-containing protein [bacterium]
MTDLAKEIKSVIDKGVAQESVALRFTERLKSGKLTRDENSTTHFCAYFLPYNKKTRKVFIIHHKKSGLWLSPGGHIDKGETLMATLNREIDEELGIKNKIKEKIKPFLLTITPIDNPIQPCKEHLDIWYRIPMDEDEINANTSEFHASHWVALSEARELITDRPNLEALEKIEQVLI